MLAKRIVPCLDVDRGRVVKGTNFLQLRDAGDPVEVAARYEAEGADELVFLDITASHEGRGIILDVVRRTAEVCFMPVTVGGGIRTLDDIRALLNAGADKVSINSAAVKDPGFVEKAARRFGRQCIVVNVDPKRVTRDGREVWEVHVNGGRIPLDRPRAPPAPGLRGGLSTMSTVEASTIEAVASEPEANKLFRMVMKHKGSDLHLKVGLPPCVRMGGVLRQMALPALTTADMERLMFPIMTPRTIKILEDEGGADFAHIVYDGKLEPR